MTGEPDIDEVDLHAYADGQLPPERLEEVESWLEDHPADAERVARWKAMNERIRASHGTAGSPTPAGLRPAAILVRRRRWLRRLAAAAVVTFLIGGASGWLMKAVTPQDTLPSVRFADEGIGAHKVYAVEARHPVEIAAGERGHLQAWLSKRLDHSLTIPDLSAAGYRLIGGRLLANFDEPRAMFLYETAEGLRLTVYAGRNPRSHEVAFRFHRSGSVGAICWLDRHMGYAVVAEADEPKLLRLAHLVQQQV